jgi:hypothetical protein
MVLVSGGDLDEQGGADAGRPGDVQRAAGAGVLGRVGHRLGHRVVRRDLDRTRSPGGRLPRGRGNRAGRSRHHSSRPGPSARVERERGDVLPPSFHRLPRCAYPADSTRPASAVTAANTSSGGTRARPAPRRGTTPPDPRPADATPYRSATCHTGAPRDTRHEAPGQTVIRTANRSITSQTNASTGLADSIQMTVQVSAPCHARLSGVTGLTPG